MNFAHLRYFRDAASAGSLSSAARTNHISQSAISQAIRLLEAELGCELITHQRNRFQLTSAGRAALQESEAVFKSIDRLRARAAEQESEARGPLTFACSNSIAIHHVTPILVLFQKAHPRVDLRMRLGNSEVIREWLRTGEIDLGISIDETPASAFQRTVLSAGRYLLVSPPARTLSRQQGLLVTRRERPEVIRLLRSFAKAGRKMAVSMEITSWEVIRSMVLAGDGICGICPDYVVAEDIAQGRLKSWSIAGWEFNYELQLLQKKSATFSPGARLFAERLKSQ